METGTIIRFSLPRNEIIETKFTIIRNNKITAKLIKLD